jgi:hypothetical protein
MSPEERAEIIRLLYASVTLPGLDFVFQIKWTTTLTRLVKCVLAQTDQS